MTKIAVAVVSALLITAIGIPFAPMAEAQSRDVGGGFAETPNDGGSRPDRGGDGFSPSGGDNDHERNGSGGSFSCPPTSDPDATGVCGLPLLAKDAVCNGRGGGSSTGPDGGFVCTVPD